MIEFFLNWLLEPIVYLVAGIWGAEEPTNARWAVGCLLFLLLASRCLTAGGRSWYVYAAVLTAFALALTKPAAAPPVPACQLGDSRDWR